MTKLKITGISLIAAAILAGGGYFYLKNMNPRQRIKGEDGATIAVETLGFYNSKGQKINGRLYKPDGVSGKMPTVVFCHGFGSTISSGEDWCKAFASRGWAAYAFDFRGGSHNSSSDGETTDMSVLTEIEDLTLVIGKLRKEGFADRKNLFVVGQSQGGEVAALTAADLRKDINSLVLIFPAFCIQDDAQKKFDRPKDIPDTSYVGFMKLGKNYYKDTWKLDPFKKIGKFKGPVLIMHGTMDNVVPYSYSEKARSVYHDARLEKFDGAGHAFTGEDRTRAVKLAADFIAENIK